MPNGIPSHDTFSRVFARICPEEFQKGFLSWISAVAKHGGQEGVSIDGKTLRGSLDRGSNQAPIQIVSAWACENGLVLGQVRNDKKSNETTAIPKLLEAIVLNDTIFTIDAAGCQKEIGKTIRKKGADYVLALKGNQGDLHEFVEDYLETASADGFKDIEHDCFEEVTGDHGRVETRPCWVVSDLGWLKEGKGWKDLKTVGMIEAIRETSRGQSIEHRFYISSLSPDAWAFSNRVGKHWPIENRLHWVLGVAFNEDACRAGKDYGPQDLATLRPLALNLYRQDQIRKKRSIKSKHKGAGWDNNYLLHLLGSLDRSMLNLVEKPRRVFICDCSGYWGMMRMIWVKDGV